MPRPKDKDVQNPTTRAAVVQRESTWLNDAMDRSQKEGKEYYPVLTQRSFDKLKRNRDSLRPGFWSDEDEAQVLAQWDSDRAAKPLKRPNAQEQYIWKTSVRFLRCLPTELIGMRYGLEYDTEEATSQNWPETFCKRLVKIIAHPLFANNPAKIALAIKFSVCSWQRLKWVIPSHNDLFLQTVKNVAEQSDEMVGAELVRDSIQEWRDIWPDEPELPQWAQLLKAIVAHDKQPVSAAESPHRVATKHLSAIVDSLDEITHGKLVTNHSVDVYERALKDIRANVDLPTNKDPVDQLLAEGIIHNRRLKVLRERYPDVADIYQRVSRPQAPRPVPKVDPADIYDGSSEDNESSDDEGPSEAGERLEAEEPLEAEELLEAEEPAQPSQPAQPAQPAQANPPAKRKRGRPKKIVTPAAPASEADDGGSEVPAKRPRGRPRKEVTPAAPASEADDGGSEVPAKRPRGRPRKEVTPAAPAPEETIVDPTPSTADADVAEDTIFEGSNAHLVRVTGGRGEQNRTRIPSVPDSIANAGEQRLALPSRGLTPDNGDGEDGMFIPGDDDLEVEQDITSPLVPLPQRLPGSSLFDARPGTSRSEELGQDPPVGEVSTDPAVDEDVTNERGTNEVTPNEPSIAGTIAGPLSIGEAVPLSAGVASSDSGGGLPTIDSEHNPGPGYVPGGGLGSEYKLETPFAFPHKPRRQPVQDEPELWLPGGSNLPTMGKERNKPSAPVSVSKKARSRPIESPTPEEQRRRLKERNEASARAQGKVD